MCWGLNERPRVSCLVFNRNSLDWRVTSERCVPGSSSRSALPGNNGWKTIRPRYGYLQQNLMVETDGFVGKCSISAEKYRSVFFLGENIWDKIWWQSVKKINWILGWVLDNWENHSFPMALWCLTIFHDHKVGVMSAMSVTFRLFGPNSFSLPARALHFFVFEVLYRVLNWKLHFYLVRIVNTGNTDLNELERTLHVLNMQTMI